MAKRKQLYVYRIFDGHETIYVGKGSGRRLHNQMRCFGLEGEVIEECRSDDHAFEREVHWIEALRPTANKLRGGNGGRCASKRARRQAFEIEYEKVGPRRVAARFLIAKMDDSNCEALGVSKVDLNRLREVANGPWC